MVNEPVTGSEYVINRAPGGVITAILAKKRGAWPLGQALPPTCTAQTTCTVTEPLSGGGVSGGGDGATITLTLAPPGTLNLCATGGCSVSVGQNPLLQSAQAGPAGAGTGCTASPATLTSTNSLVSSVAGGSYFLAAAALLDTGAQWNVFNTTGTPITICADATHKFQPIAGGGGQNYTVIARNTAASFTVISASAIMQTDVSQ